MNRWFLVFVCLVFLATGVSVAADAPALCQIDRKAVDDLAVLRTAGIPVVLETRLSLFVLGGASDLAVLTAKGYAPKVLDSDPSSVDYLMVGVRPDTNLDVVREAGAVLHSEENLLLLRVPNGTPLHDIDEARAFVSRIPETPVAAPRAVPTELQQNAALVANPIVQKIVATVTDADIMAYWQAIVNNPPTGTRFSTTQGCRDAATYCFNTYTGLKLGAQNQTWSGSNAPNVIGTHTGAINPGNVYILEAHLDDLPSSGTAPGADDNGSGTAQVLEAAKVLSCWGVRNTIKFLNVTGEEQGLFGSDAYAADALTRGENILGVLNFDMPGWAGDGIPAVENLDLNYNAASQWLAQRVVDAAATYGTGLPVDAFLCPSLTVSDHYPFWQRGWSAVCGITDNEGYCSHAGNYPFYHTANDTIANSGNPAFYYKVVRTVAATLAELADPFKVTFAVSGVACGVPAQVILADRDLNTNVSTVQTAVVHVWSATEPGGEDLTLSERGVNSMLFDGSIPTTGAAPTGGDGIISIAPGDTLHVDYLDALDCDGTTGVAYSATAAVDCVAPVISGVSATNVTGNSATINWSTDEASSSVVHYGTTPPGGSTASSSALVTTHAVGLTSLNECSNYAYWVQSSDLAGNVASDNAGGSYYAFATGRNTTPNYPSTGSPLPIPDNNATGVVSSISVPDDKIVQDVNVRVNITHTYVGDLTISLLPPVGAPITLFNRAPNSSADNFTNTVFDDAAATPITSGTPPFTGSFRPANALSSANGIHSIGGWGLKVVDSAGTDTGTIDNWTLMLTYPASACGPHAAYGSQANVADVCAAGGPGNGNGAWDAGEQVQLSVGIANDGSDLLTGVTAVLSSTTPGVVINDGTASYPDIPAGGSANSMAPHFTVTLPQSVLCGGTVAFSLNVQTAQGSWAGSFTHGVGTAISGSGTALDEHFNSGIPGTWTVVNGGTGGGAAATWTTANPGARTFTSPLVAPVAIVDSDNAGSSATQDEQLITPVMNLSTATAVTLQFDQYFRWYSGGQNEFGDVDVKSSLTGGAWVNVFRNQGAASANPDHRTLNITAQAAGAADVQVRFHYYQAAFEWWWQLDNVLVTYTAPPGCTMSTCAAASPPPPVPDGTFGSPMTASRAAADGSSIAVGWDTGSCTAPGYKILYGPLSGVSLHTVGGSACALSTSGNATWSSVPAGDLWFVVVATNGAGTEGTWGSATAGPMGGTTSSATCGDAARSNAGACP